MDKLKENRLRLNLTQTDMAKAVGVSLNTYQLWEKGISTPKPENQEKLEKVLGTKE